MRISNTCKKMKLPNGKVVDILSTVFEEMEKWLQDASGKKEAGGYIVGYQHYETENITLEQISHPYRLDIRKPIFFSLKSPTQIRISRNPAIIKNTYSHPVLSTSKVSYQSLQSIGDGSGNI